VADVPGGLIVTASPAAQLHRELIISLAARHKLPAVYPFRYFHPGRTAKVLTAKHGQERAFDE
jgi:hypothetical protein